MPKIWPHDMIRELLALAETQGESSAELESEREAELFRFAIYSFRRTNAVGEDVSVKLDGNRVVLTHKPAPSIRILQADATP